jgi:hypothetical protein
LILAVYPIRTMERNRTTEGRHRHLGVDRQVATVFFTEPLLQSYPAA